MRLLLTYENSLSRAFAARHLGAGDPEVSITTAQSLAESLELANYLSRIDAVALDLGMPDMNGLAGLRRFRQNCRHSAPIALMHSQAGAITAAGLIAAGGAGFLPYHMSPEALLGALRVLAAGERYLPADMVIGRGVSMLADSGQETRTTYNLMGLGFELVMAGALGAPFLSHLGG